MHHAHYRKKEDADLEISCGFLHFSYNHASVTAVYTGDFLFFMQIYTKIKASVVLVGD